MCTRKIPSVSFVLLFLSLLFYTQAEALQVQIVSQNARPGDTVTVDITVAEYNQEQIAAAAFTLSYSTDHLTLTSVESAFFGTFLEQWNSLTPIPDPLPPTSVDVDGEIFTKPQLVNTITGTPLGKTMLVAARVEPGVPTILFTLQFTVKADTPAGVYPVSISPIIINNVNAGYDVLGEGIPLLMDIKAGEADSSLAYTAYTPDIINGIITVQDEVVDSDNDGIDDAWELKYFGNLTTATQTSDFDKDGYSDLQEYLNNLAGETDPQNAPYDPKKINAPGGTGYNPPQGDGKFWLMILPAILNPGQL